MPRVVGSGADVVAETDEASINRTMISASWAGPLPPPSLLAEYDAIVPGFAERLLSNYEQEGEHRRSLERADQEVESESIRANADSNKRGQTFGLVVAALGFVTCIFLAYLGYEEPATSVAKYCIVSLTAVFVAGRAFAKKWGPNEDANSDTDQGS